MADRPGHGGDLAQGQSPGRVVRTKVSPSTGMRGYPAFTSSGIEVTTLFNPTLQYGGNIQVESQLTPACGTWNIYNLAHELESEIPSGKWFTTLSASKIAA